MPTVKSPPSLPSNLVFNEIKNPPSSETGSVPCPALGARTALAAASEPPPPEKVTSTTL